VVDKIELLQESLIEENPELAMDILAASTRVGVPLGWHYVLDLIWLLKEIDVEKPATILDAGAGGGLMQYLLADLGYQVISADMVVRDPRSDLRRLYEFDTMGTNQEIDHDFLDHLGVAKKPGTNSQKTLIERIKKPLRLIRNTFRQKPTSTIVTETVPDQLSITPGKQATIFLYRCDLKNMQKLPDSSVDAVVSVSAIEHNPPEISKKIMQELERVTKPEGSILITVSAGKTGITTHPESHSYVLDETALLDTYNLVNPGSNFSDFDSIFERMTRSKYLQRWLSSMYYNDGKNGMPWGIWAPSYLPVGIRKTIGEDSVS
jgi:ubiquinone/menaquinone biosynthesis C-methylase UbiE